MKLQLFALSTLAALTVGAYPKIAADSVKMTQGGNKVATISYLLENEDAVVTLDIEARGEDGAWRSIGNALAHATGDCWRRVSPGPRTITWRARKDWKDKEFADDSVRAVVTAWPLCNPPDYMVVDLDDFSQTFYPSTNFFPNGLSDVAYRTTKLVMRKIPAEGTTFVMGQSADSAVDKSCADCFQPKSCAPHLVSFSNDYYMAVFEMTQGQHKKLGRTTLPASREANDEKPVDGINFVNLRGAGGELGGLLKTFRDNSGLPFDLPTEAEWECACRAGTTSAFSNGEGFSNTEAGCANLADIGWFKGNRPPASELVSDGSAWRGGLQVVGLKLPNAWGLYDMHGNVSEWCRDYACDYDAAHAPLLNPSYAEGQGPVKRGGNWYVAGVYAASSARRYAQHPDWSLDCAYGDYVWSNGYRLMCPVVVK